MYIVLIYITTVIIQVAIVCTFVQIYCIHCTGYVWSIPYYMDRTMHNSIKFK